MRLTKPYITMITLCLLWAAGAAPAHSQTSGQPQNGASKQNGEAQSPDWLKSPEKLMETFGFLPDATPIITEFRFANAQTQASLDKIAARQRAGAAFKSRNFTAYSDAIESLQKLGDPMSYFLEASRFAVGWETPQSDENMFANLKAAADAGLDESFSALGLAYLNAAGTSENKALGRQWLAAAYLQGDKEAGKALFRHYRDNYVQHQSSAHYDNAILLAKEFEFAYEGDIALFLGKAYLLGKGVTKDLRAAQRHLETAAGDYGDDAVREEAAALLKANGWAVPE